MRKIHFITVLGWLSLLVADLLIGAILGIALMAYDDMRNNGTVGESWSWATMNTFDKCACIAFYFWQIFNLILLFYILKNIYKWVLKN